jgi:hypothetical protein
VISTQPKRNSKGMRLSWILLPLTKTPGSINGWNFARIVQGRKFD